MKKAYFSILLIWLLQSQLVAQTILGPLIDSCHKAYNLLPSSSTAFINFSFKSSNKPDIYSILCQDSISDIQSWFKFSTGNNPNSQYRIAMRRKGCHIQIFKNACGTLQEIYCLKIQNNPNSIDYATSFINLEPNTNYKVRVGFGDGDSPFGIAIQTILGRSLHSTITGGFWHLPTSWQEGRVPIDGDSI